MFPDIRHALVELLQEATGFFKEAAQLVRHVRQNLEKEDEQA